MTLPVPNLDDREFQAIVDEAKRRIPLRCPEWTNHNLTDPGVALIELFAWMTEITLFKLNQVPDKFYTHMLNMMGFEPFPATAARTDLTFWLVDVVDEPVSVPAGTRVSTSGSVGSPRIFTTLTDLLITQPRLKMALVSPGPAKYVHVWEALRLANQAVVVFPRQPTTPGDRFFLGFETSLAGNAIRMDIAANVEGIGVIPSNPPLCWEVWQGTGWIPCTVYRDTTGGLNRDGQITLLVPPIHEPLELGGERAYWLQARVLEPARYQPTYRASPQIRQIRVDSIGGSVTAEHSERAPREVLGTSTGKPDQRFETRFSPVLQPRTHDEVIHIVEGDSVTTWEEVDDFVESGPADRHYVWSSTTGEVRFGPLIRYPDGTSRLHGRTPPEGALVVATGYRHGGGKDGNVGTGTLTDMLTSLPYVDRVENIAPAIGGVDAETVENAKRRGPHSLRAGGRAVTAADFERLTAEADPAIARVRCLPPQETGKPIKLLIVPDVAPDGELLMIDDFALSDDMVARVTEHLDERRILGTAIEIGTPFYQGVTIAALIKARVGSLLFVRERAKAELYRYLHPLHGGPNGSGWPFDADLNSANVFQLLEAIEGVERVEEVLFFEHDVRNHVRKGYGKELVKLSRDSLFLPSNHQVVVR